MTTMIERVARAIYEGTPRNKPWDRLAAPHKAYWLKRGRAAIEAMREVTLDMEVAGQEEWMCEGAAEERSGRNWRTMIDAALSEGAP